MNGGGARGAIGFVREAAFMCLISTIIVLSMRYYMSYDVIKVSWTVFIWSPFTSWLVNAFGAVICKN